MKDVNRIILVAVLAIFALCMIFGAKVVWGGQPTTKYWQDVIRKPSQAWIELYGYNNESVLAFNVRSLLEVQEAMAGSIVALRADIEALKGPVDVNDPNE